MFDIAKLGKAVSAWLEYQYSVSKTSDLVAESSIRFPLTEYLERNTNNRNICLEKPHKRFPRRRIDFYWECKNEKGKRYVKNFLELKYLRRDSGSAEEIQRIANDIFRLVRIPTKATKYFMLCGNFDTFDKTLRKYPSDSISIGKLFSTSKEKRTPQSKIDYILSLDANSVVFVKKEDDVDEIKENYSKFKVQYSTDFKGKSLHFLPFSTKLVYSAICDTVSWVAIWEVKNISLRR